MNSENPENELWYSVADWGDYTVFNGRLDNITHDTHPTEDAAQAVVRMLTREGFGGEGQVFPVKVWVSDEPLTNEN